jgi:hypothetical protein
MLTFSDGYMPWDASRVSASFVLLCSRPSVFRFQISWRARDLVSVRISFPELLSQFSNPTALAGLDSLEKVKMIGLAFLSHWKGATTETSLLRRECVIPDNLS